MIRWEDLDLSQPINWAHPLNRGCVAWWLATPYHFGNNDWYDLVAGYNGNLSNFAAGKGWSTFSNPGGAGSIQGSGASSQSIAVASVPAFNSLSSGTFAGWFNFTATSNNPFLFSKVVSTNATTVYSLQYTSASHTLTLILGNGSSSTTASTTAQAFTLKTWYHVAVTWNGTTTFYINGSSIAAQAQTTASYSNTAQLQIGSATGRSTTTTLNGFVNDPQLFNRALSASEIFALYTLSQQMYPDVLNWNSWDVLSLAAPPPSVGIFMPRPLLYRPRFEPAFFE